MRTKSGWSYVRDRRCEDVFALLNECCHADSMQRRRSRRPARCSNYPMEELSAGRCTDALTSATTSTATSTCLAGFFR